MTLMLVVAGEIGLLIAVTFLAFLCKDYYTAMLKWKKIADEWEFNADLWRANYEMAVYTRDDALLRLQVQTKETNAD